MAPLGIFLLAMAAFVAFVLFIIFVMVPVFRGVGWLLAGFFKGIGWIVMHVFEFIGGMISDAVRFIGSILATIVLLPFVPLNVIIGRWSAAGHFADSLKRECLVGAACLYRIVIRRPLKLFWLHGLLEGLEERVPEAMHGAPTADTPSKRTGQYEGYTIVGSLRAGGSGGKLYIARPEDAKRSRLFGRPELVVVKSFALTEGSSLPQIVRESRALECAKQLGHVLDHGMDDHRFYYVMPYHPGEHLGVITRQLHAQSDGKGLSKPHLGEVMHYIKDLLATLTLYHRGGLWHKDIKPENIIVHDGRAHVVDLGLVTPLKSAMTLTTHGTEYFRDPEMVRQALRGVKVHQVNGAKFDIYAAGAVLYFMIENTFPAHGGLSRFTHNSPEALRWIVRRAMAEYHQRYESAELMLADLEAVANAHDPFAVKPAHLPSMRGSAENLNLDLETESPQNVNVAAAGSPRPADHGGRQDAAASPAAAPRRPTIRVTNWWTGEYVVEDEGRGDVGIAAARRAAHAAPAVSRPNPHNTGRRTAAEQLAAARGRVRDMQKRAVSRRHRVGRERQPSPAVIVASLLVLAVLGLLVAAMLPAGVMALRANEARRDAATEAARARAEAAASSISTRRPLVVVVDAEDSDAVREHARFERIVDRYHSRGYHIATVSESIEEELRTLVPDWRENPDGLADTAIEDILADLQAYGVLYVDAEGNSRNGLRLSETLIYSTRDGAKDRRWPSAEVNFPAPEQPYLLVNDHPARNDARVQERVERQLAAYQAAGYVIAEDIEAEAAARTYLPAGTPLSQDIPLSPTLSNMLREHEFHGIAYVYAPTGDGAPHERVRVEVLSAQPDVEVDEITVSGESAAVAPVSPKPTRAGSVRR